MRDVPVSLQVSGACGGRAVTLWSVRAAKDGLMLISAQYIRPRSVMEVVISIPDGGEPLKAFLSVTYVQRSACGYGIGVQFVGLSAAAKARWTRFVGMSRGIYARQTQARNLARQAQMVIVSTEAMSERARLSLQEQQLDIALIRTPSELRTAIVQGRCQQLVLELSEFDSVWAQAIEQARCLVPTLQLWLLTGRDTEESLAKGFDLGAAVVVAKPCSHESLAMQLRSQQQMAYAAVIPQPVLDHVLHA